MGASPASSPGRARVFAPPPATRAATPVLAVVCLVVHDLVDHQATERPGGSSTSCGSSALRGSLSELTGVTASAANAVRLMRVKGAIARFELTDAIVHVCRKFGREEDWMRLGDAWRTRNGWEASGDYPRLGKPGLDRQPRLCHLWLSSQKKRVKMLSALVP